MFLYVFPLFLLYMKTDGLMKNGTIASILTTELRLREDKALPILSAYSELLEMKAEDRDDDEIEKRKKDAEVAILRIEDGVINYDAWGFDEIENAKSGSILVIPVRGIMMRNSSYSWWYGYIRGTEELERVIRKADATANINAIVFKLNSPGGQAAGNESLSRVIQSCSKPTLVSFEGMASAALEAFIGCTEIYALEKDSYFGSLGTMMSYSDWSKYDEANGIVRKQIYAPQSKYKNHEMRESMKGNDTPMEERLGKSTEFFINDVKSARPKIEDDGRIFAGAIYNAVEAEEIKAIDGIRDLEYVLTRAATLGRKNEKKRLNKSLKNRYKMNKELVEVTREDKTLLDKVKAFFSDGEKSETEEEKKIKSLTAAVSERTEKAKELESANSELTKTLKLKETEISELTESNKTLSEKVESFKLDFAAIETAKTVDGEKIETVKALVEAHNKTFDHNKELGGNGKSPNLPVTEQETELKIRKVPTTMEEKRAELASRKAEREALRQK